jgi:hypothetical protein
MRVSFERVASEKIARAALARIGSLTTVENRSGDWPLLPIGSEWSRAHCGGDFHLFAAPPARSAVSLVFVQSRASRPDRDFTRGPCRSRRRWSGRSECRTRASASTTWWSSAVDRSRLASGLFLAGRSLTDLAAGHWPTPPAKSTHGARR